MSKADRDSFAKNTNKRRETSVLVTCPVAISYLQLQGIAFIIIKLQE